MKGFVVSGRSKEAVLEALALTVNKVRPRCFRCFATLLLSCLFSSFWWSNGGDGIPTTVHPCPVPDTRDTISVDGFLFWDKLLGHNAVVPNE